MPFRSHVKIDNNLFRNFVNNNLKIAKKTKTPNFDSIFQKTMPMQCFKMKRRECQSRSSVGSCHCCSSVTSSVKTSYTYNRIKVGLKKSIPAAIVLWAFHKMPSNQGLTSRRVISFLKRHYKVVDDPGRTGKSIGAMLRCAVDFGLLEKRGKKYYLPPSSKQR